MMITFRLFPLACALATFGAHANALPDPGGDEVQLELRPRVVAGQRALRLDDIVVIRTRDLAAIRELIDIPVGRAPRPGSEIVVERDTIARWVRSHSSLARERVVWTGPREQHLSAPVQSVAGARLEATARGALQKTFAPSTAAQLAVVQAPHDIDVALGTIDIVARPVAPAQFERATVWLDIRVGGEQVRSVPVTFRVEGEQRVARVRAAPATEPTSTPKSVAVDSATRAATGSVTRGDWVVLQLKAGGVELERRTQALQDGRLGDTVRVRGENGPIEARVTAPGRVEAVL
jgi:hypothetical protein